MNGQPLAGRTALVTGGALRLGREICLTLADRGADIVVHYRRSREGAERLVQECLGKGTKAWAIAADFDRTEDTDRLIGRALDAAGRVDILVNSASIFPVGGLAEMTYADFEACLRVNAWTPFRLGRDLARRAGRGAIVNILDTRIDGSDRAHAAYILSKQALYGLTRMMAAELAPAFTVNAVAPGLILPPPGKDESYLRALAPTVPLGRHGGPGDVAQAVAYLVEAEYVTGQVIFVDGGRHVQELGR